MDRPPPAFEERRIRAGPLRSALLVGPVALLSALAARRCTPAAFARRSIPAGAGGCWRAALRLAATVQIVGAGGAYAQDEAADTFALDTIVVSLTGSPTALARLPFSASLAAGPALVHANSGLFVEEALHALPGVRVHNRFNASVGERISIRGFGARSQFGVRGIRIVVDGIPATLPDGQTTLDHLDLGSLARVEVLRGPGASLYGNGAGGVIILRSAPPYTGAFRQDARLVVGSNGLFNTHASASGSAGGASYRASFGRSSAHGFRQNVSGQGVDPYSSFDRTTVNAFASAPVFGGSLRAQASGVVLDALNPGSLPFEPFDDGSSPAWSFNVEQGARKSVRQAQAGLRWLGPLAGTAVAVSIYGVRRELDNPIPTSVVDLGRSGGGARMEAGSEWRRRGLSARIEFGIETGAQIDERRNFRNRGGEAGTLTLDQEERVGALAVFATLRLSLAGRLDGAFALRADRLRFQVDDRLVGAEDPDDSGARSMGAVSPSLGLYLGLGRHGLFAALSRSFETPTTSELANRPSGAGGFNPELEPARGWSAEAGARGALGPDVQYDATLFTTYLSGQLVPFEVPSPPGRRFYRNAGRSRTRGIEVFVDADHHSPLSARIAYEFLDARYTDFDMGEAILDGNRVPGVAPHRAEATIRADVADAGPGWFAELRVERRGEIPLNDANDATAPGHTLLEVRIGATNLELGRLRLAPLLAITNLANRRYASSVVVNAFGGRYFEPGPTRGGYLGLSVGWERT